MKVLVSRPIHNCGMQRMNARKTFKFRNATTLKENYLSGGKRRKGKTSKNYKQVGQCLQIYTHTVEEFTK